MTDILAMYYLITFVVGIILLYNLCYNITWSDDFNSMHHIKDFFKMVFMFEYGAYLKVKDKLNSIGIFLVILFMIACFWYFSIIIFFVLIVAKIGCLFFDAFCYVFRKR